MPCALVACALALTATPAAASACGWMAVADCYRSPDRAQRQAGRIGGRTKDTTRERAMGLGTIGSGWFCVVDGPYFGSRGKEAAQMRRDDFRRQGTRTAEIKPSCR